ncbi:hypothetical protein HMPREF9151_00073 [Hoylesella saccharolytica F0055]|uniref:Uncharacterized protein n=1 Tax=Hoylesella saccharolytica F0055 TaxID=1127699 RepID=L1NLS7_9BACT|nr:hypothetical protein HMPREF9151_00073 [Hoylesella saccharolytica F0055]
MQRYLSSSHAILQAQCTYFSKAMLSRSKSYAFGMQNLCFWRVKPMLLEYGV